MFQNLTGWHALIILAAVLLIFGAAKLPALARSVGQSVRILKSETKGSDAAGDPQADVEASGATVHAVAAPVVLTPAPRETGEPVSTAVRTAS